jgi:hypothetical protein
VEAKDLPITARRLMIYGVRRGAWRSKEETDLCRRISVCSYGKHHRPVGRVQEVDEGRQERMVITVYGPLQVACAWDP